MGGTIDVDRNDLLSMQLGGEPKITYTMHWRDDAFIFDHKNTIFLDIAIRRVEAAMKRMRKEHGIID